MILTQQELKKYRDLLDVLPPNSPEVEKIKILFNEDKKEKCRNNFLPFVREMWGSFIAGKHHKDMAEAFERVAEGSLKRLIINMPPRHTKSEFASFLFPAWFLGRFPEKKIIQTAHTAELAVGFGRKVRNLVATSDYQGIFPTKLSSDSKAAGRWNTHKGGDYFAIGVGGAVTGKGADVLIIDDPHSEQEAMQGTANVYDRVYEWYNSGPRQRLQPGGAIIIVMCMTGETPVLMANGKEKHLRHIRSGDYVSTYDNGILTTAKVLNWKSNGYDLVYTIKTISGIVVRANGRHPFLVDNNGEKNWIQLKDLQPGMELVSLRDAVDHHAQSLSVDSAVHVNPPKPTIKETQTLHSESLGIMANIKKSYVKWMDAIIQHGAKTYVYHTTTKHNGLLENTPKLLSIDAHTGLKADMASLWMNIIVWLKSKMENVQYVDYHLQHIIHGRIGMESCVLTTAMTQVALGDYYAMTATSQLDTPRLKQPLWQLQNISAFTTDQIVDITPDGEAEVFDIQIERTENFIANGLVSHNTRWSKKDLTGQILANAAKRDGDTWEVIEFPALMPSGKPLWGEFWSQKELETIKAELPVSKWEAQYQQNPTSEEGAIIKREMWKRWESDTAPPIEYTIQSWDTAFEKNNRADYSACTTWGIFYIPNDKGERTANIILLEAIKERMEFPELKARAMQQWKEWNPDTLIVEKKAAGAPLIYEMRRMGIPISEYTPSKGSDKIARVNAISDLFASGMVWCPDTRWADEVMEECASFPNGDHDDLVDSTSQALLRFRQGGFIRLQSDEEEEVHSFKRKVVYY